MKISMTTFYMLFLVNFTITESIRYWIRLWVLNITFNNISVILWWSD